MIRSTTKKLAEPLDEPEREFRRRRRAAWHQQQNESLAIAKRNLFNDNPNTYAHLEKKRTRLRLYTKSLEEIIIQTVETASPAIATASELDQDDVRIFKTASGSSRLKRNPRSFIEATASGIL
ncbi:hypothetical protein Tco_0651030 [Tanacetum coccineum]